MEKLTIPELEERIDDILAAYDEGDDTAYLIEDGERQAYMLPYDGPYTETVQQDENGEYYVQIPKRICAKLGLSEGDEVEFNIEDDNCLRCILLKKKQVEDGSN